MGRSLFAHAIVTAASLAAATAAHAGLFSFAADSNSNQWTIAGSAESGGFFAVNSPLTSPITLLVAGDGGPLPALSVQANLVVNLTAQLAGTTPIFGSVYEHDYSVSGTVQFVNPNNSADVWLTITLGSAQPSGLVVIGGQNTWNSSGNIQGSSATSSVSYTASASFQNVLNGLATGGATAASYGVTAGTVSSNTDFGFTLTVLNQGPPTGTGVNGNVALDPQTGLPTTSWRAESSFSGSAIIPAPGSLAIMGFGGLIAARRRRD